VKAVYDVSFEIHPIVVYGRVRRNSEPRINAISTIILLVTTALIHLADRLSRET
jgi:ABC-type spermidine/putrescine transport system permease subunit II